MIDVMMVFGGEFILIKVNGHNITFGNSTFGAMMAPLSGLKLSQSGVVKEFPDLKDNPNWQEEAIARFRDKINGLDDEIKITNYLIEDLKKFGYKPMYMQRKGFRRELI